MAHEPLGSACAEEDFDRDFALGGELDLDEAEVDEESLEIEALLARVQVARDAGV